MLKIYVVWMGVFNPKSVLIEFVVPNLSVTYVCISEIFRTNVLNIFFVLNFKITFFNLEVCDVNSKSYFFSKRLILNVLKLSGILIFLLILI